jgi:P-type Ca2+ transporter type 2C
VAYKDFKNLSKRDDKTNYLEENEENLTLLSIIGLRD